MAVPKKQKSARLTIINRTNNILNKYNTLKKNSFYKNYKYKPKTFF